MKRVLALLVVYQFISKGPAEALAVCEAVARDNAPEVAKLVAQYSTPFTYSYTTLAPGSYSLRNASAAYECNGLSLEEFAQRVGADKTATLLKNGKLDSDSYVAETKAVKTDSAS
ncbi:MAG: DUF3718 domain-containing protein [Halioglobus sp.]